MQLDPLACDGVDLARHRGSLIRWLAMVSSWPVRSAALAASSPKPLPKSQAKRSDQKWQRADASAVAELVGPASETREAHMSRHDGGLKSCPRCKWYALGLTWASTYGSFECTAAGPRGRTVWLSERPRVWGGTWGLGCSLCADAAARRAVGVAADASVSSRGEVGSAPRRQVSCKWTRYEVRASFLQAEHVKQHVLYDCHKVAVQAFLRPGELVTHWLQRDSADDSLLSGAVPQPPDWLRAWSAARELDSWSAAARIARTEHFIASIRAKPVLHRSFQQMILIMREVVRERKRQWIRDCLSISMSFDDWKGVKAVKWKCDAPLLHSGAVVGEITYSRHGILGCFAPLHDAGLEDMSQDYAERTCLNVVHMVTKFATHLLGGAIDTGVVGKFKSATTSLIVDGALLKVGRLLKLNHMPNIKMILRDPAHAIRTACQEPLIRSGRFEEQNKRLFTAKHALLKDLRFSECWQARLRACQKLVVAPKCDAPLLHSGAVAVAGGHVGEALVTHIIRHISFAPHRFESFVGPRRQYVCMLNAIFLCLAGVANDVRQERSVRDRAVTAMESMTPRDIFEAGLAGDFGEICIRLQCSSSVTVGRSALHTWSPHSSHVVPT